MMFLAFLPRPVGGGDAAIVLVVAMVGYGVGFATASVRASQTIIWPRPRFAQVEYGIATNGCSLFCTRPLASSARPIARPLTTCTPLSMSDRNSEVSALASGRTMLRTLPLGLSGH